jgi:hypothetical protein
VNIWVLEAIGWGTLFALIPAAVLLFVGRVARLVFIALGLMIGLGIEFVIDLGGPDSPALIIPFLGFVLVVGAICAELVTIIVGRLRNAPMQRLVFRSRGSYSLKERDF